MRGLDVLDIDLVSILEFTGVDSFSGVSSSISTLMDSITVFVLLLNTLYARLLLEYPRKMPSSLFVSNFPRFSQSFRI